MPDSTDVLLEGTAIPTLAARLDGRVVVPADDDYDDLRQPWLRVMEQHPALIVDARSVADVVAAVTFAQEQAMTLAVMATGHGIAAPCDGGLLLRVSSMTDIVVDPLRRVARFSAGVRSEHLLAAVQEHGLMYPAGQALGIGVTGYSLGGGIGWLVRKLGAAADAILSAEIVLADGSVVHASDDDHPELFWALRGGGGNFGVVVSLEMRLDPLGEVVGGELWYPLHEAGELLRFYREWAGGLPDDTSTIARLVAVPPDDSAPAEIRGTTACMIGVCHSDPATAEAVLAPLLAFRDPLLKNVEHRTVADMAGLEPASHSPGASAYGQVELLKALSDEVIDGLVQVAETCVPPLMQIEVQQLGGALLERGARHGSFTPPDAPYLLHLVTPAIDAPIAQVADATRAALASLGDAYTGEAYFNFLRGDEQGRVGLAFDDATYSRLREVKRSFDPDNLFRLNLNIDPASSDS